MDDITNGLIETEEDLERQRSLFLPDEGWQDADISKNFLDVTQNYDSPRYSLCIGGVPCAPVGGLHVITGQPGNGKTNAQSQLIAAYLGDTTHGIEYNMAEQRPKPKVLYVDTEMEPENTMMVNLRICAMTGRDFHTKYEDLDILMLRNEISAVDRWTKILKAIWEKMPNVVFIDGLIDIVSDFNDNTLCQEIIFKCMALATFYDINLWTTIHQNPGSTKMTGHAGSFLERKATDIFQIVKDKSAGLVTFKIEQTKARGKDVPELMFKITTKDGRYSFGVPEIIMKDSEANDGNKKKNETIKEMFENILMPLDEFKQETLKKMVQKYKGGISENEALNYIKHAQREKILVMRKGAKNSSLYSLNTNSILLDEV